MDNQLRNNSSSLSLLDGNLDAAFISFPAFATIAVVLVSSLLSARFQFKPKRARRRARHSITAKRASTRITPTRNQSPFLHRASSPFVPLSASGVRVGTLMLSPFDIFFKKRRFGSKGFSNLNRRYRRRTRPRCPSGRRMRSDGTNRSEGASPGASPSARGRRRRRGSY